MDESVQTTGGDLEEDVQSIWAMALENIRSEISSPYYASMFTPLRLVSIDGEACSIAVPNSFTKEVIDSRFRSPLERALSSAIGRQCRVILTVRPSSEMVGRMVGRADDDVGGASAGETTRRPDEARSVESPGSPVGLPKRYTFENFVVGDSNKFAYNAATMVAENPGYNYNPLFIYGGTGLGKTHLMMAIKDYAEKLNPSTKVKYVQTSVFIDEFIATLTLKRDKATFDQKYINNRIVLFDDIQALSGTDAIQNKFFDVFNLLYSANSHIVLSSDRPPKQIEQLSDRIQSRFEGGLLIDVKPPDLETRLAILRMKARAEGVEVPDDAMIFIASKVNSNIRTLEGLLNRVVASARLYGTRIDLTMVQDVLKDQVAESETSRTPTVDMIQNLVSSFYDISLADLVGKSRSRALVHGRQVAMYLCRDLTNETLISVGSKFGNRDHSTVLHSCRKVETMIKQRRDVLEEVRELTNMISKSTQNP